MSKRLFCAVLLAIAGGCGGGSGSGGSSGGAAEALGACDMSPVGGCQEYRVPQEQLSALEASCVDGVWMASCPAGGRLGACTIALAPSSSMTMVLYRDTLFDVDKVRLSCAQEGGIWSPGETEQGRRSLEWVLCSQYPAVCTETFGLMTEEAEAGVESLCQLRGGRVLWGVCPLLGRTGSCTQIVGEVILAERFYDPATEESDRATCLDSGGSWASY